MIVSENELRAMIQGGLITRPEGKPVVVDLVSIGLHLGNKLVRYKYCSEFVELPFEAETEELIQNPDGSFDFPAGSCILACTEEFVQMPNNLMAFVQTKGSIARGFVTSHLCDGQIDPGFSGSITLELVNLSQFNYILFPGIPIAQLFFHDLSSAVKHGYSGSYQNSLGPTAMKKPRASDC